MSWFQSKINTHESEKSSLVSKDPQNPFISQVVDEEFVKVPIRQSAKAILPTVEGITYGSANEFTNVSE